MEIKFKIKFDVFGTTNYRQARDEKWPVINYIEFKTNGDCSYYDSWDIHYPDESASLFKWCEEYVQSEWAYYGGRFYFRDTRDLTFFALRWM